MEAGKADVSSNKTADQVTDVTQGQKVQTSPAVSPKPVNSPAVANPVGWPETQAALTPAAGGKGSKIKRQLFSSGTVLGGTSSKFYLGPAPGDKLSGTVGQVGVGSGSSESFGTSGGFWQAPGEEGLRGDVTGDEIINVGDVVYLVSYLYKGGPAPDPVWVGDCNCDDIVNVGDIVFLVSYLYKGGPEPVC
jgi:hypothetical protein